MCALGAVVASTSAAASGATPLGTAFTYQGQLKQAGVPLDGTADFEFSLWDDPGSGAPPVGGVQVGLPEGASNVSVVGGQFTVDLDFGPDAFNGQDARWLEIAVRSPHDPGDTAPFTTLSPRQPLAPTPLALQTRGITVDDAGNVGIGTTTPQHPLSLGGATADTQGVTLRSYSDAPVYWKGGAAFGYDSASVILGELSGVATIGGHDTDLSAWADLAINLGGNVGIGTATPGEKLTVAGTVESTAGGFKFPDGSVQSTASGAGLWAPSGSDIYYNAGNVGIGTATPATELDVIGDITVSGAVDGVDIAYHVADPHAHHTPPTAQYGIGIEDCTQSGDGIDCTRKVLVGVSLFEEHLIRLDAVTDLGPPEEVVAIDIEKRWRQPAPTIHAYDVHVTLTEDPDTHAFSVSPETPVYNTKADPGYTGNFHLVATLFSDARLELTINADKVKRVVTESPGYVMDAQIEPLASGATEAQLSVRIKNDGDLRAQYLVTVTDCDFPVEPVVYQTRLLDAQEEVDLTFDLRRTSGTFIGGEQCKVSMWSFRGKLYDVVWVAAPAPAAAAQAPTALAPPGEPDSPASAELRAQNADLEARVARLEALMARLTKGGAQ